MLPTYTAKLRSCAGNKSGSIDDNNDINHQRDVQTRMMTSITITRQVVRKYNKGYDVIICLDDETM